MKFAKLNTKSGKTYAGVTVREATPTHLKIFHASGIATIAIEDLPKDIQRFLKYDSVKAAEYAEAQATEQKSLATAESRRRRAEWLKLPSSKRYTIQPAIANGISLRYEDNHSLVLKERTKAEAELVSDEILKSRVAALPQGGTLIADIDRSTIESANSKWFLVIVSDLKGKELVRRRGSDDIANEPINGGWWNSVLVDIPMYFVDGINVRVVETLGDSAYTEFSIRSTK